MRLYLTLILLFVVAAAVSQPRSYPDEIETYRKKYITDHEVVKGGDRKFFRFFKANEKYKVEAGFEKITDSTGFVMKTSGAQKSKYFRYGILHFIISEKSFQLTIYRSEALMAVPEYKDYLFVPFTDQTSGEKSYGGGRYLDFTLADINGNKLILDFNKAYNPYCAYATGYNCPIPPAENILPVAIEAGEMEFAKKH